jgi:hypothetical protein
VYSSEDGGIHGNTAKCIVVKMAGHKGVQPSI